MDVPLATVELSFDGTFELGEGDAEILLQLHSNDVMWQKERLLNLLIDRLPVDCDRIAWIDCDVVFMRKDWPPLVLEALEKFKLIQLYANRLNLTHDATEKHFWSDDLDKVVQLRRKSFGSAISDGHVPEADFGQVPTPDADRGCCGLAWASTREILEQNGLYDACILGGSDRLMAATALGRFDLATEKQSMIESRQRHFLPWARNFYRAIQGKVGFLPLSLLHLWHGDYKDRQYITRYSILNSNDFDPANDIALDDEGVWKWSSHKPKMHSAVKEYFDSRHEDGR